MEGAIKDAVGKVTEASKVVDGEGKELIDSRGECSLGTCRTSVKETCLFRSCCSVVPIPRTGTLLLSVSST
jgi:hypothetical protein